MIKGKDYDTCDHCKKDISPGEIGILPQQVLPLLTSENEVKICEYCYGYIESQGDDVHYWTEWVKKKRQESK